MQTSQFLTDLLGAPVLLKCENLQRTGSYKIRGAYNRISRLTDEEKARGVVAASAGNHAQGVAFAARELGIRSTIFMPLGVALPKLQATRNYGAEVVLVGHTVQEPLLAAAEFAERTGAVFIHPFDHPDVVAGQGTLGLDVYDEVPDLATVVVPIGGGGLISGVASAIRQRAAAAGQHGAHHRRAGGERRRVPGLAGSRRPDRDHGAADHRRRHRGRQAGRAELRHRARRRRRDRHGHRRPDRHRRAHAARAGEARRRAGGRRRRRRDHGRAGRAERHRPCCCSPAATSTRS